MNVRHRFDGFLASEQNCSSWHKGNFSDYYMLVECASYLYVVRLTKKWKEYTKYY